MSKFIVSISLYFALMFLFCFFIPGDNNEPSSEIINSNISAANVDSSAWSIGNNLALFASFFSFSLINPLGMPGEICVIFSIINVIFAVFLIYGLIVLVRGGGGV